MHSIFGARLSVKQSGVEMRILSGSPGCSLKLLPAAWLLLSLAPAWGQTQSAAKVLSLVGQVSVLRDSAPWALNPGDSVQPKQVIVTGADGFAIFTLADGSRFEVFPNSRVVFRQNPGSWSDLLDLYIGRIKVHIQKLGGLPNHNRVRTPTAVISVRGTVFDVAVEDEDDTTLISVEEGQVVVEHLIKPGVAKILNPGESIRVFKNQPLARVVDKGSVVQNSMRAAAQAMYELIYRTSRTPAGTGGGAPAGGPGVPSGGQPGDTDKGEPPPAPPPPPPQ